MKVVEIHEVEPLPGWCTVGIDALRPNPDRGAAEWRRSLPEVLAGIVGEVPGAELDLGMLTDDDGMVAVDVAVSAGELTSVVAAEIASALEPVAETGVRRGAAETYAEWPIVEETRPNRLGFVTDSTISSPSVVPWQCSPDGPAGQLIEELAAMPGHGVRVRLRAAPHGVQPRWEAQLRVVTTSDEPSLRLRAAIRRRFSGLQVARSRSAPSAWLRLDTADLPTVFAFPIAGAEPLAGAHAAPAAPIAVTPPRARSIEAAPGLRIGHAVTGGGRPVDVELTESERLRHVHVLGRTGTGKSSALAGIVHGLAARGDGALIADPHGQLCDRILAELPDEGRERVWVIRCGDVDNPVPINPLAETDPARRDIAIAELCATFQYVFDKKETGIVGPRFKERVAMTLRALSAVHGTRASLLDVPLASADDTFMAAAVKASDDERLKSWWRTNKLESRSNEHGQVLAWVNSKFELFSNTAAMRAILGSGADAIDFAAAMDDGRIILLDLSKAQLGEAACRLLGFLYLNRLWEAALRRAHPERPFTVIVDEAHTLIAGALTNMLAEGRKFGLSVMLAHQYLDQLDAELRPAVDGNVATTIAFRCAVGDAREVHKRFGGLVESSVMVTLPDLTAISLRTAMTGPAHPHSLMIDHNTRVAARSGADLNDHTSSVMTATYADIVDPHRDITTVAAAGTSNITAIPLERPEPPRPAPRPVKADRDERAADPAAKPISSLDRWLADRTARVRIAGVDLDDDGTGDGDTESPQESAS